MTAVVLLLVAAGFVWLLARAGLEFEAADGIAIRQVFPLETLPWEYADTGWRGVAQAGLPTVNGSFATGPLRVGGRSFDRGIGVFPTSEIVYRLDGQYLGFQAGVALDDNTPVGGGQARFFIFGDDQRLFDSGVMAGGDALKVARVAVHEVRELRLVVVDESGGHPGYAAWLRPQLRREATVEGLLAPRPLEPPARRAPLTPEEERRRERAAARAEAAELVEGARPGRRRERTGVPPGLTREEARAFEQAELDRLRLEELAAVNAVLSEYPAAPTLPLATYDAIRTRYVLLNERLAVFVGYAGRQLAAVTVLDRARGEVLLRDAAPRIVLSDGTVYRPDRDLIALESPSSTPRAVDDAVLGRGAAITARLLNPRTGVVVHFDVTLYERGYYIAQLALENTPPDVTGATFDLLDLRTTEIVLPEGARYVTDFGRPSLVTLRRDGVLRAEPVGEGKPLFLWGGNPARAVVLAALDETDHPAEFEVQLPPRRVTARVRFGARNVPHPTEVRSPRFYVEFGEAPNAAAGLANYRAVFSALYPPLQPPPWFRFEWNSWYNYYMDINEAEMQVQIDYIADYLSDIGPWQVALDAGWYRAEGAPDADWRTVDTDKFPSGIAALASYARQRGVRMILYFSAPYVDTRERPVNWLGLRGLVEAHPEFVIKVDEDELGSGYLYDVDHPGFQRYFRSLMEQFFVEYGVDGIEVDGLGTVPTAVGLPHLRDRFGIVRAATSQTMKWYRLIHDTVRALRPDAYIYAGWHLPLFANQYAHAFWYSDEYPAFSNPYPYGGLREHVDYAILQQAMWGQRSHMGYAYGDPNVEPAPRWWLEAAIALGTQISLGFDMRAMWPEVLSEYRARLVHYHPHAAPIFTVGQYPPDAFGTHRDGTTYLGVMNREDTARTIAVDLEDIGLERGQRYLVYDVTAKQYLAVHDALEVPMPPESFRLFLLRALPGVMWTDSSFRQTLAPGQLTVQLDGPEGLGSFLELHVPEPRAVLFNGVPVRFDSEDGTVTATYDPDAQVLRLQYPMGRNTLVVRY